MKGGTKDTSLGFHHLLKKEEHQLLESHLTVVCTRSAPAPASALPCCAWPGGHSLAPQGQHSGGVHRPYEASSSHIKSLSTTRCGTLHILNLTFPTSMSLKHGHHSDVLLDTTHLYNLKRLPLMVSKNRKMHTARGLQRAERVLPLKHVLPLTSCAILEHLGPFVYKAPASWAGTPCIGCSDLMRRKAIVVWKISAVEAKTC